MEPASSPKPLRASKRQQMRATTTLLALAIAAPSALGQADLPPFVAGLLAKYRSAKPGNSPDSVWSYQYKGAMVYYVPPMHCCDIPSSLYDINGKLLCRPDGGIAGAGDGKCPDFIRDRKDGKLLWSRDSKKARL